MLEELLNEIEAITDADLSATATDHAWLAVAAEAEILAADATSDLD